MISYYGGKRGGRNRFGGEKRPRVLFLPAQGGEEKRKGKEDRSKISHEKVRLWKRGARCRRKKGGQNILLRKQLRMMKRGGGACFTKGGEGGEGNLNPSTAP